MRARQAGRGGFSLVELMVIVGLLAIVLQPAAAAALLVVPSFVTNVWQLAFGPAFRPLLWRLWPMLLVKLACSSNQIGLKNGKSSG